MKTTLHVPDAVWARVRIQAFKEGRSASALVVEALLAYLREREKKT